MIVLVEKLQRQNERDFMIRIAVNQCSKICTSGAKSNATLKTILRSCKMTIQNSINLFASFYRVIAVGLALE